ncbi:MAG: tRNA uridine-5-carboxymethylaminomethyl(34) synthesis GTPase MnmE [Clostridia bacterium]|nr:tRNA uridine-5-carboxymethylaminomethyl(34) synthesis GTPase MnmE [Clostridia bacterium]MDE7328597.1 tRNA uridine-5-carboxymethylaminomethyl(34) synthesis GTPase MnmE [Clostridia bacterium]
MKTIATISTPIGRGAIAIIRMSGDKALEIAARIFSTKKLDSFTQAQPNYMYFGRLNCGTFSDSVLAVYFKTPNSYTGEDVVEFQCHGGIRLVNEILKTCIEAGCEPADKGEFTKRAFLNGKIALSDAEGIIDMINGESISALNASFRLSNGEVAQKITELQNKVLDCVSELEASLDYPEEMEEEARSNSRQTIDYLINELTKLYSSSKVGGYIRQGINVAIIGQANVGKSSLLNALLGRERAIVTNVAGTTRDSLEEYVEVDGVMLKLIDTAGIRETDDVVEAIGVERSIQAAKGSDIILFVTEAGRQLNDYEKDLIAQFDEDTPLLLVINKCDVAKDNRDGAHISAIGGKGIDELKKKIVGIFVDNSVDTSGTIITNERHSQAIKNALDGVKGALASLDSMPLECTLIDLREAYFALGEITGNTASESIIDNIFSKFCLGK